MTIKSSFSILFLIALLLCGGGARSWAAETAHKSGEAMTVEDERAISAVLIRYATGIDRRDWKLFATCFTENVTLEYDGIGKWNGRDVFVKRFEEGHAKIGPTMHKLSNFVITVNGDHATATSYIDALLMPLNPGGTVRRANGRYEDELVREKDGWKISHRRYIQVQLLDSPT